MLRVMFRLSLAFLFAGGLMAQFVGADFVVPPPFKTTTYKLVPLGPEIVKQDYEAYMSSIDHLQKTFTDGTWPHKNVTMADAIKDLEGEAAMIKARKAFNYAVMTMDGKKELGCVYIGPSKVAGQQAQVRMWVTKAEFDKGFETQLRAEMKAWIGKAWAFKNVGWPQKTK
jgi:hypothetical protein